MTIPAYSTHAALRETKVTKRRPRFSASLRPYAPIGVFAALMVMVVTGRLHDALLYGKLPIVKIFVLVGAALFFMSRGMPVLSEVRKTLPARAFLALTLAVIASVPFSVLKSWSFELASTWLFASVPMVLLVCTSIRSVADLERVLKALLLMILISAAIIFAGRGTSMDSPEGPRLSLAGSYDPNDFAAVIAASSATCLWALRGRSWLWKLLGLAGLACSGVLIVKTGSRGGAVALGTLLIGASLFLPKTLTRSVRLGVLLALAVGVAQAPSGFSQRMSTLTDVRNDYNLTATDGRIAVWTRGLGYVAGSPLVGVGAGAYPVADGRWAVQHGFLGGFKWSAAHNLFIETAAELGLPGLVALLCCLFPIVFTWRRLRELPARSDEDERLRRAVEAIALTTLTYLLATMFVNALYGPMLLTLISLNIAAHVLVNHSSFASRKASLPRSRTTKVFLAQSKPRRATE